MLSNSIMPSLILSTLNGQRAVRVIYIHLESFQQFLIDYKLKVDDKEYEVTP